MERKTAIIKSITLGLMDRCEGLMLSCDFNMNNSTGCGLSFTMDEAKQMMLDVGLYDDIEGLVGKPCEIEINEGRCIFRGMWKFA